MAKKSNAATKARIKKIKARRRILNVNPATGKARLPISGRVPAMALRKRRKKVLRGIPLAGNTTGQPKKSIKKRRKAIRKMKGLN